MNRFALLTLYRSLTRHSLYAALNIGGLAIGIAAFIVLSLYVRFETGYERWLPNSDQVYVVEDQWLHPGQPSMPNPNTMAGMFEELNADFPTLTGTRVLSTGLTVLRSGTATAEEVSLVDPGFFDVFPVPVVRGDARAALADPANVLLSESMARKYFPGVDPIGRTMTLVYSQPYTYRVAAILKDSPKNTDTSFDIVARLVRRRVQDPPPAFQSWYHWGSEQLQTFLRFPDAAAARALEGKLDAFVVRHATKDLGPDPLTQLRETLLPFPEVHFQTPGAKLTVITLGLVGLLTLLIAVVNYINLATARAGLRAREVAMRKVLGANRAMLIRQFVGEAILTVALATLIGLALAELTLPLVNAQGGLTLAIQYFGDGGVVLPLLVLAVVVGLAAGFYPAFLLAGFPAAAVLASSGSPSGGRSGTRLREGLVVFQFALATAFIVGTLVLAAQTRHVRHTDIGFTRDGLVLVEAIADSAATAAQRSAAVDRFKVIPGVRTVALANSAPGNESLRNSNTLKLPGRAGDGPSLQEIQVGNGFFGTLGARLIAGRLPDAQHRLDDSSQDYDKMQSITLNRSAVAIMGFASPQAAIGKIVGGGSPRTIIGVVDDMRFFSPREETRPTYYRYTSQMPGYPIAILRTIDDPRRTLQAARAVWRDVAPQVPFAGKTVGQSLDRYYKPDEDTARLFTIGAALAVLIGCVGLWGLASFNTQRRTKEIGIRKTLGASSRDVVTLLVMQFLRPVLLANLLAWPLAYLALHAWLAGFEDRIALSPLDFIAASLLAAGVALLTVVSQSLRASRAAPAWALRRD